MLSSGRGRQEANWTQRRLIRRLALRGHVKQTWYKCLILYALFIFVMILWLHVLLGKVFHVTCASRLLIRNRPYLYTKPANNDGSIFDWLILPIQ
jgi:hypothetical protein